uniref:Uncharacterized protein n=1 Tax=Erinnyis ello granulovirus TaxID=307444 RepID=A0A288WJE0_9BBAC|nr:hypothetical protein EREL_127 [Erinnyis ello granulovirus]
MTPEKHIVQVPVNSIYQPTTIEMNTSTSAQIFWNACVFVGTIMLFLVLAYLYYATNL